MNFKLTIAAIALSAFALTACTKKEEAPKTEGTTAEAPAEVEISAEQQALIDSVDKPDPEAIAIDESVVAAADAENAAAEAGNTSVETAASPELATSTESAAEPTEQTDNVAEKTAQ